MLLARAIAALGILIASTVASFGDEVMLSDVESQNLRPQKVTPLGLYLSSEKANRILAANPGIIFIDVRDPLEVATSGHPAPVDAVVPIKVLSNYFDSRLNEFAMVSNPNFVREVEQLRVSSGRTRDDVLFVTCGSGYRSAEAVRILVAAGYTQVWHITDGYNGETKPGMNSQNAWLNQGLPWSHRLASRSHFVKEFMPY